MRQTTNILLASVLALTACSGLTTKGTAVDAGTPAPGFTLPDGEGRATSLEALLADGPAVLVFYRAWW